MRVMELAGWPPGAAGPFKSRGDQFTIGTENAMVENVTKVDGKKVNFICRSGDRSDRYFFDCPDEKVAAKLATILKQNIGKSLFDRNSA